MNELEWKDKKLVLSSKALEMIYHMDSSSVGKLISGKQYLGSYVLDQVRDKVEAEGKELPFKKKNKLPQQVTALASTSRAVMEHLKIHKIQEARTENVCKNCGKKYIKLQVQTINKEFQKENI